MLKIVVFDSGYGGELFADRLEFEIPTLEVIRVIDWRNAKAILESPHKARKFTESALRPYIGTVDLIFFANHLVSITSLKYFQRKYRSQKFLGFKLPDPAENSHRKTLILSTRATTKTVNFFNYLFRFKGNRKTLVLDHWTHLIDDGELSQAEIVSEFDQFRKKNFTPEVVVLTCGQFSDIKNEIKTAIHKNIKILDSFDHSVRQICKELKIRGGAKKRK